MIQWTDCIIFDSDTDKMFCKVVLFVNIWAIYVHIKTMQLSPTAHFWCGQTHVYILMKFNKHHAIVDIIQLSIMTFGILISRLSRCSYSFCPIDLKCFGRSLFFIWHSCFFYCSQSYNRFWPYTFPVGSHKMCANPILFN